MDYQNAAQQVLDCICGRENILSAAHCATRLRLVIADSSNVRKKELENAEGVKGVFEAQGQLQIIFGTSTVNQVYDAFLRLAGIEGSSRQQVKQTAAGDFALRIAQGVELVYTEQDRLCVLRFSDPAMADGRPRRSTVLRAPCRSLRVVGDRSSLEFFLNDGAAVFSTRYYPVPGNVTVNITGTDAVLSAL